MALGVGVGHGLGRTVTKALDDDIAGYRCAVVHHDFTAEEDGAREIESGGLLIGWVLLSGVARNSVAPATGNASAGIAAARTAAWNATAGSAARGGTATRRAPADSATARRTALLGKCSGSCHRNRQRKEKSSVHIRCPFFNTRM